MRRFPGPSQQHSAGGNEFILQMEKKNHSHRDTERPWLSQVATPETQASSIWAGVVSGALQGVEVG